MRSLEDHLRLYGIRHFSSDSYWEWRGQELGPESAAKVDKLRKPFIQGRVKPRDCLRFSDYIANPRISYVVHSVKADAIRVSGLAVQERIEGRQRILDLGCGIGYLTTWYASLDNKRSVLGIDFSKPSVHEAKRKATELGIHNVDFQVADISQGLSGDTYDAIVDTQTLEYVGNTDAVCEKLHSVIHPDGLLVSVPALGTAKHAKRFLRAMTHAGFSVVSFDWMYFSDCGESGAYPVITATASGQAVKIDLDGEYQEVLLNLDQIG